MPFLMQTTLQHEQEPSICCKLYNINNREKNGVIIAGMPLIMLTQSGWPRGSLNNNKILNLENKLLYKYVAIENIKKKR